MNNIQEAYDNWSATYDPDENRTRDLDQIVTEKTLANSRYKSILEIGCGTGKNTCLLSKIGKNVHAIDFSEGMISLAREKLRSSNVTFSIADITHPWHYDNASIDLVVCNLVLEHIENLQFIFSEAFRVLTPTGHFFVSELHPFRQYQGTQANFQTSHGTTEIQAFVHHISDFLNAAKSSGFRLKEFKEWWHETDQNKPPRLVSFMFKKINLTKEKTHDILNSVKLNDSVNKG
ncbi:MAG: class I SAM-dependent methyltransferase [Candidatus Poribacteria bacterium]|nr:class I SAM-dependent methyltransferase [Candidatus Poribacteria bacterium]